MPLPTDSLRPIGAILAGLIPSGLRNETATCAEHGEYTALTRSGLAPMCPTCMLERDAQRRADRVKEERRQHLRAAANLPPRYIDAGVRSYPVQFDQQRIVVDHLLCYLRDIDRNIAEGRGLIMAGNTGTGKTRLACGLANNIIHHLHSVRYTTVAEMIGEVRSVYGGAVPGVTEAMQIKKFVTGCDVLILDEIDIFKTDSLADLNLIYRIVDGRYQARKPIIAVTNQTPDFLDSFLGERAAGRVRENSLVLTFNWPDYRQVAA